MKIVSRIFLSLSFAILFVAVMQTAGLYRISDDDWWEFVIIEVAAYAIFGMISHLCIQGKFKEGEEGTKFVYYATFPAFIISFVVYIIIVGLVKAIKYILKMFGVTSSSASGGSKSKKSGSVYVVYDGGFERKLSLHEQYKQDYDNPNLHYDRYIDDLGNYWRTYDDGETFRKETLEEKGRGY